MMSKPNMNLMTTVQHVQRDKKVEKQLKETILKLTETEANITLFRSMIAEKVATNDVRSFVVKQMNLKKSRAKFDNRVLRTDMKSKLDDALCYANRLRQQRSKLRSKLFNRVGCSNARKIINNI